MRTKSAILLVFCIILSMLAAPFEAASASYSDDELQAVITGITDTKLEASGAADIDDWVENELPKNIGADAEWYIIALSRSGHSGVSSCEAALVRYIETNNIPSASTREKLALTLCAVGSRSSHISEILDSSIDKQGIMSRVFGLHLMNNGYTCRFTTDEIIEKLLSMQLADGGWAVVGQRGDADVTAMVLQALAPHIGRSDVSASADRALGFLSSNQQSDGGYTSMGKANPESAAQVLTALSALGIDAMTDQRFIKGGNTVFDGILKYRLPDGSFCHEEGGEPNATASVQTYCALTAYRCMKNGKGSLYVFGTSAPPPVQTTTTSAATAVVTTVTTEEPAVTSAAQSTAATTEETTVSSVSVTAGSTESAAAESTSAAAPVSSSGTVITTAADAEGGGANSRSGGYKPIAIAVIVGAGAVLSLVLLIIGKRNVKNFIAVAAAAAVGVVIVLATDVKTPDDYYGSGHKVKENAAGTVTLSIRCDTIKGKASHIPEDGVILPVTSFDFEEGETVKDILTEAAREFGILIDAQPSGYIAGIASVREFDFGDLSGWVYYVNGTSASVGCAEYRLSDGDVIEWHYTCDLGRDIEEAYKNAEL